MTVLNIKKSALSFSGKAVFAGMLLVVGSFAHADEFDRHFSGFDNFFFDERTGETNSSHNWDRSYSPDARLEGEHYLDRDIQMETNTGSAILQWRVEWNFSHWGSCSASCSGCGGTATGQQTRFESASLYCDAFLLKGGKTTTSIDACHDGLREPPPAEDGEIRSNGSRSCSQTCSPCPSSGTGDGGTSSNPTWEGTWVQFEPINDLLQITQWPWPLPED